MDARVAGWAPWHIGPRRRHRATLHPGTVSFIVFTLNAHHEGPAVRAKLFGVCVRLLTYHFALMFHGSIVVHCCLCACVYLWGTPKKITHCRGLPIP